MPNTILISTLNGIQPSDGLLGGDGPETMSSAPAAWVMASALPIGGLDLGTQQGINLNLLAPYTTIAGKVYYLLDTDGNGVSQIADSLGHDVLDKIFNNGADTVDTQASGAVLGVDDARTTNIAGYTLVLPTTTEFIALRTELGNKFPAGWQPTDYDSPNFGTATRVGANVHHNVSFKSNITYTNLTDGYYKGMIILQVLGTNAAPVLGPTDTNNATNNVNENVAVGTVVSGLTIAASDADSGATISYSLTNNAGGRFEINAMTGVVTVAGALNFEAAASHDITVQALSSDGSVNTANFTININNQNDAPTGTPYIAGTALQGSTLTIERNDLADEDGINQSTFLYKWYADGVEIANENSAAITLKQAQVGKSITAAISYDNLVSPLYKNTTSPTVAVGPVLDLNDAPVAVASNVTATEDQAKILVAGDFGFSDALDAGAGIDTLLNVRIESLPATGTGVLTLNGAAVTVGQVVAASALVNTNAGLVFTPATNINGPVSFTFSVQDNGGTANGGADWSVSAATMTLNIAAVNDAPVLTVTAPAMAVITEDAAAPVGAVGTLVSALVNGVSDVDASALRGVAISATNAANGTYHYSLNNGANWTAFPAVSNAASLLLAADSNTRVYFQPAANFNGTVSNALSFRAWDQTSGTAGQTVNTTVNGGTTAFSATSDAVSLTVNAVNDAPTLVNALLAQTVAQGAALNYQFAPNSFADIDAGDALIYTATRADGGALPSWLSFTPATRTFSGTPANGDVGVVAVKVTATDTGNSQTSSTFNVTVSNVNDAPTLANALLDRTVAQGSALSYQFAANSFVDIDAGDVLTYTATKADGSALPSWLSFTQATRTFSGTPANGDVGVLDVKVTAKDGSNAEVSDNFTLTVANVNDAPTVANALLDKVTAPGLAFSYTFPINTFADVDVGDTLTFSAQLVDAGGNQVGNGNLPSWLGFNAATRTFSGTVPASGDTSKLFIKVTARDSSVPQASVSDVFELAQIVKQASFTRVAATSSATGELAIYGIEVSDLASIDLGFSLSGTVLQGTRPLSDYLRIDETSPNKATVFLRQGVTMQSLIDALGGLSVAAFNVNVNNGGEVVTDVVRLGGPGSDVQIVTNTAAPTLNSSTSPSMLDNVTTGDGRKVVYQASAADANAGLFTFGLDGPDARFFDINSTTGAVTIKSEFVNDPAFLARDNYTVNVITSDGVLGATRSSSTQVVIDNPEVAQASGVKVVATTAGVGGINDSNAIVGVKQMAVAPSQLPTGVDMPFGRSEIVAKQEVDQGSVPTNFSIYVAPNANINGFWTTVNGALVNLADSALGGAWNPATGEIKLDLAEAAEVLGIDVSSVVINGELTLSGAPARIDLGSLGANPLQVNDLFWS